MNLLSAIQEFNNKYLLKNNIPAWFLPTVRTSLKRNITIEAWNEVIKGLEQVSSDSASVKDFITKFRENLESGDLSKLISDITEISIANNRKQIHINYINGTTDVIVVHDDKVDLVTKETFDKAVATINNTINTFKESVNKDITTLGNNINNVKSELTTLKTDLPKTYMKLSDREKLIVDIVEIVTNMESSGEVVVYGIKTDLNREDYTLTVSLTTSGGTVISTDTVDFPLESVVVGGDEQDGIVTLTLQNGNTISFDIGDLVYGLVSQTKHDEDIAEVKALINTKIASAITTTLNTEV
jgi:hypothetical protein